MTHLRHATVRMIHCWIEHKYDGRLTIQMPQAHGDDRGPPVERDAAAAELKGVEEWISSEKVRSWTM